MLVTMLARFAGASCGLYLRQPAIIKANRFYTLSMQLIERVVDNRNRQTAVVCYAFVEVLVKMMSLKKIKHFKKLQPDARLVQKSSRPTAIITQGHPSVAMTGKISFGANIAADSCACVDLLNIFISVRLQNYYPWEFIRATQLARYNDANSAYGQRAPNTRIGVKFS